MRRNLGDAEALGFCLGTPHTHDNDFNMKDA
jgi:hypothetical protein